jgi:hypothetical protein
LRKIIHQADKSGNAEVTEANDANKASNNNAHADDAIEAEAGKAYVAKDNAADVANKRPHPLYKWTLPQQKPCQSGC